MRLRLILPNSGTTGLAVFAVFAVLAAAVGCEGPGEKRESRPQGTSSAGPTSAPTSTRGSVDTNGEPGSGPSSTPSSTPNSAASLPAGHRSSTTAIDLEGLFRMPDVGAIVARVNDRAISKDALAAKLRQLQVEITAAGVPLELSRLEVLSAAADQLVEEEIRRVLAKELQVTVSKKQVDLWLDDLHARMDNNPPFKAFLCQAGRCSREQQREDAETALLMEGVMQKLRERARTEVETQAQDYYQRNKEAYLDREGRQVWRIFVKAPSGMVQRDRDVARARAEDIHGTAKKFEKIQARFEDLARSHSDGAKAETGGTLDWVQRGSFPETLDKMIWESKPNSVLPMYEDPLGYWIYRVGGERKARQRSFAEVKDQIIDQMYHPIVTQALEREMARLRAAQKVEIAIPELKALNSDLPKK